MRLYGQRTCFCVIGTQPGYIGRVSQVFDIGNNTITEWSQYCHIFLLSRDQDRLNVFQLPNCHVLSVN